MADLFLSGDIKVTLKKKLDFLLKQIVAQLNRWWADKKTDLKFHSSFRDPTHDAYGILLELNREKKHMEHVLVRWSN